MLWALTKRHIISTEIQQAVQSHHKCIGAQSAMWLSRAQAQSHYGVQCCGRGVTIDVGCRVERTAFSIAEYSLNERKALLRMQPPPPPPLSHGGNNRWLLRRSATCASSKSVEWTAATLEQYFWGSLFAAPETLAGQQVLLVDAEVAVPSSPLRTLSLFNAQETSNPFLIDDTLTHKDFVTGAPLPPVVANALSTKWLQFGYTSMLWLPGADVDLVDGVSVLPGQEPHVIFDLEPIDLVHFHQTSGEQQKMILHSAPRWALMRSMKSPLILSNGRWRTWRQMNLDGDVKLQRAAATAAAGLKRVLESPSAAQYKIWLHCDGSFAHSGTPQRRHVVHKRLFYNSSQLLA